MVVLRRFLCSLNMADPIDVLRKPQVICRLLSLVSILAFCGGISLRLNMHKKSCF